MRTTNTRKESSSGFFNIILITNCVKHLWRIQMFLKYFWVEHGTKLMLLCCLETVPWKPLHVGQSMINDMQQARIRVKLHVLHVLQLARDVKWDEIHCLLHLLFVLFLSGFVDVCVQHVPSPKEASRTKVREIYFHWNITVYVIEIKQHSVMRLLTTKHFWEGLRNKGCAR